MVLCHLTRLRSRRGFFEGGFDVFDEVIENVALSALAEDLISVSLSDVVGIGAAFGDQ
jgi:hypothetical protein